MGRLIRSRSDFRRDDLADLALKILSWSRRLSLQLFAALFHASSIREWLRLQQERLMLIGFFMSDSNG